MTTRYRISLADEIIEFEGPDDLSDAEIEDLGENYLKTAKPGDSIHNLRYAGKVKAESGAGGSFARGSVRGGTFNWGDEIASSANAAIPGLAAVDNFLGTGGAGEQQGPPINLESFVRAVALSSPLTAPFALDENYDQRYEHNMDALAQQEAADEEQHPVASGIGEVAGGLSTTIIPGMAAARVAPTAVKTAMAAHPVLSSIPIGGVFSGVSSAGAGEGNRAQSAALGGLSGAVMAPLVAGAISYTPAVAQYAKVFMGNAGSATREAIQQITLALKRDGFDVSSPTGIQKLKNALQEYTGKPISLADLGAATRSRAGVALRAPSEQQQVGIDTVMSRQAGQGQRLSRDIRETVAPRTDVHAIDEDLSAQRAEEAARLRDLALFENVADPAAALEGGVERTVAREVIPSGGIPGERQARILDDPTLQNIVRLPFAQRALKGATDLANEERMLLAAQGLPTEHLPYMRQGSDLDMRTLDYLKRFLDDETNMLYKRGQGRTYSAAEAQQVKQLRDTIRERMRTANPEYGNYLDAYRGSSEMMEALEEGQNFANIPPELIQSGQGERSTAAQELYRIGVARNLLDTIKSTRGSGSAAGRILNSPEAEEQLAATGVDPSAFDKLKLRVGQERNLSSLTNELQGAHTAQRLAAQADAEGTAPLVPFNPASGYGWAGAIIRSVGNRMSTSRNAAVNQELIPRLLSQDPKVIESTISELEKAGQVALARQIRRSYSARTSSVFTGNVVGSPVALPEENY